MHLIPEQLQSCYSDAGIQEPMTLGRSGHVWPSVQAQCRVLGSSFWLICWLRQSSLRRMGIHTGKYSTSTKNSNADPSQKAQAACGLSLTTFPPALSVPPCGPTCSFRTPHPRPLCLVSPLPGMLVVSSSTDEFPPIPSRPSLSITSSKKPSRTPNPSSLSLSSVPPQEFVSCHSHYSYQTELQLHSQVGLPPWTTSATEDKN